MPLTKASLLAALLFSETKDINDAKGIAWVVRNRTARPKRFNSTLEGVIRAPKQFSGVGSKEWQKAVTGNLTKYERTIYNSMLQVSKDVLGNKILDPTGGADHYVNLELAQPNWIRAMTPKIKIGQHTYFKE